MAGADLLWENSTIDWLVAGDWCWFSKNTADWLADKPSEHIEHAGVDGAHVLRKIDSGIAFPLF